MAASAGDTHPIALSLRTGQPYSNVIMGVYKPSGELTWISINLQPLFRRGERTPYAAVASFFDVTERKQAEVRSRLQASTPTSGHVALHPSLYPVVTPET